jgi:S1-C subfamily serine protease
MQRSPFKNKVTLFLILTAAIFAGNSLYSFFLNWNQAPSKTFAAKQRIPSPQELIALEAPRRLENELNSMNTHQENVDAVVSISNMKLAQSFWDVNPIEIPAGAGSGFIWDTAGHVVTNFHVVQGGSSFVVTFKGDPKQYKAEVAGVEPAQDIAVLKVIDPPKNLKPIKPGISKNLIVGQKTMAIGNPFGLDHTFTEGPLSATGRDIEGIARMKIRGMLQTQAAINPGNSGGILLDSAGFVIGMNTMIFSPSGGSVGVGFAVPIDTVSRVVPSLIKYGRVIRPALGIVVLEEYFKQRLFGIEEGLVIKEVVPGGAADKAGLLGISKTRRDYKVKIGDIITKINQDSVNSLEDIYYTLEKYKIGDAVEVTYVRDGREKKTKLKLVELKKEEEE